MTDEGLEYVLDGDVVLTHQLVDEYRQMRSELRDITIALDDERINNTMTAAEAAREMLSELEAARSDAALTRCQLKESRDDERQAMAYLSQVRKIVGGDDFLDMIERVKKLQAELKAADAAAA